MTNKEILKQFSEISKNLMSRCSPDSDIYPLVVALISLFNLVINLMQGLKENLESQVIFFKGQAKKIEEEKENLAQKYKEEEEENKNLKQQLKELQEQLSNSTITNVKLANEAINGKGSEKNIPTTVPLQQEDDDSIFTNSSNPDFDKDVNGKDAGQKKRKGRGKSR